MGIHTFKIHLQAEGSSDTATGDQNKELPKHFDQLKSETKDTTLSVLNKTTESSKVKTADTQNSQASNTTKTSQKKVKDISVR